MALLDVIFNRRSVRRYKSKKVPEKVLKNIFEAGRLAPSAMNAQPWHFIVVTDPNTKYELSRGIWNKFLEEAAFVVVGCGEKKDNWSTIDVTIALENMVLAAEAQGVRSCWIGDFKEGELKKLLSIPDHLRVVALISFGYSAEEPSARDRKSLEEIIHYNRF
jgi:nitroreductase